MQNVPPGIHTISPRRELSEATPSVALSSSIIVQFVHSAPEPVWFETPSDCLPIVGGSYGDRLCSFGENAPRRRIVF
jgi:hypothetical protein